MKTVIEIVIKWMYNVIMNCAKPIQWILSKIFPFNDCNAYTKERMSARAALSNIRKNENDMKSTLYNGY